MPKSPFDNMPRELNLYMMSFFGRKKYLNAFAETCKYFNELSKEKSLEKYFEPDFTRPGELQDVTLPIGYHALALANNCQTVAAAEKYGQGNFSLVDARTGEVKKTIVNAYYSNSNAVNVTFTKDDKFLIIAWCKPDELNVWSNVYKGNGKSCVDVWNVETLQRVCRFEDFTQDQKKISLPHVHVLNNNEFIVSFNQNNSKINETIFRCNIAENTYVPFTKNDDVICSTGSCVSPDRKILAQLSKNQTQTPEDGVLAPSERLTFFNLANGEKIKFINFDMPRISGILHTCPSIYFVDQSTVVCAFNYFIHRINVETEKVEQLGITGLPPASMVQDSFPIQGNYIALKLPNQTMIWDLQTMKAVTTLPYLINDMIWDDEHKNLIMNGNFDNSYSVKFMHIPHRLKDKAEPAPERSSPRP